MNEEVMQDSLFQDPLGVRLRVAREDAGLSREQVGSQLKLPVAIVEAMEREDWPRLGAPVYVRSYVGSYLRLLGLPAVLLEQATAEKPAPPLVTLATRSRMRHTLDTSVRNLVYLVMTAVLVVPVVLVARHYQARERVQDLTLDPGAAEGTPADPAVEIIAAPVVSLPAPPLPSDPPVAGVDTTATSAAPAPDPVMASMAPFPKAEASAGLVLRFRDESWLEVMDAQGRRIERGLVAAGDERRYDAGQIGGITLGNADGVEVSHAGRDVDLAPFRSANVARFAVSSDGAPAPAAD